MRKTIKIFIASSIVEFANERMAIENFIRKISDDFEDRYDVKIKPILCENLDDAYSTIRKQEEYNEEIRQSELCFFIFFTKAGQYTQEEFEVARKAFEESGKPKIYTYFKIIKDGEGEQSLYEFMKKLDEVFGHYYGSFDHVDTIKLRILLSLKLREMDFLEIKSEDGKCVVDGKAVMSLNNVAEFQNNSNLAELQNEFKEIEQRYYEMKPIYAKGGCDDTFYREYCKIASRRQDIIDEIEQLQKAIFNMSMRMSTDETHGEVTPRQKEAYRLFELGDYDGCMAVLDADEIKNDYLRKIKMLEEQKATVCRKFIRENKTAIDILMAMTNYQGRFDEIVRRYEDIVPVALAEGLELDVVYDYVDYLQEQNNYKKAIKIGEKLNEHPVWNKEKSDYEKTSLYNLLGVLYNDVSQSKKSENYYLKAVKLYERLVKISPKDFNADLAIGYNNIGVLYQNQGDDKRAEFYFLKAIEIREVLAKENPEKFNSDFASSCNNLGIFYNNQSNYKKAELYFLKAIEIREVLAKENPEKFNSDLALSYNNIGVFYDDIGNYKNAEKYYHKAITLYEKLALENAERYNPDLAMSFNNIGVLYCVQGDNKKASTYYIKAIELYEIIAKENLEKFGSDLAGSYINVGIFYKNQNDYDTAQDYYFKAMKMIEMLAKENPQRFNPDLANCYINVGNLYYACCDYKKTKDYYLKAIELYKSLTKENSENRFVPDLAGSYYNYAMLIDDENYFAKALTIAKQYPDNPICKQIIEKLSKH